MIVRSTFDKLPPTNDMYGRMQETYVECLMDA